MLILSSKSNNFRQDFSTAANSFNLIKIPLETLIGGRIHSLEEGSNNIDILDIDYGYDLIQTIDSNEYGIASRIQPTKWSWDTFTIRYNRSSGNDTEYVKRINDIAMEGLYPKWTLQAYVSEDYTKLLSLSVIDTNILYDKVVGFIHSNGLDTDRNKDIYTVTNTIDNNLFIVVRWRFLAGDLKILKNKIIRENKNVYK